MWSRAAGGPGDHNQLPGTHSEGRAGTALPLPCVYTVFMDKALPFPVFPLFFVAEDTAFTLCLRCLRG